MIQVENLKKYYKSFSRREGVAGAFKDLFHRDYTDVHAVDGISFEVKKGEILGYIGANGAGKSTSIKMLTGILQPTEGNIKVLDYHPFKDRKNYTKHIGVVFGQRTQLWWDIAVIESFKLLGKIYEVEPKKTRERIDQLSDVLDLSEILHRPVRKLSLGQRMRCDLAASLIHNPSVLFLDEPTIGLDALAKDAIRNFLRYVNKEFETTIILTTHDLKEIEELCQRVVVLDDGKIIYDGLLKELRQMSGLARKVVVDFSSTITDSLKESLPPTVGFKQTSDRSCELSVNPKEVLVSEIIKILFAKFDIADLTIDEPEVEEIVMQIYRDGLGNSNSQNGLT